MGAVFAWQATKRKFSSWTSATCVNVIMPNTNIYSKVITNINRYITHTRFIPLWCATQILTIQQIDTIRAIVDTQIDTWTQRNRKVSMAVVIITIIIIHMFLRQTFIVENRNAMRRHYEKQKIFLRESFLFLGWQSVRSYSGVKPKPIIGRTCLVFVCCSLRFIFWFFRQKHF